MTRHAVSFFMALAVLTADATVLDSILLGLPPANRAIVSLADKYQLQILYTQVHRDNLNVPHFVHYRFNADPKRYFYPASLVKLPVCALALEKIHTLRVAGLTNKTTMKIDSAIGCQIAYDCDSASDETPPAPTPPPPATASVASSIKRMLLVSDNTAFNRLWEFLTRDYIHARLSQCGFGRMRLLHRLWPCTLEQNHLSNPVTFLSQNGKVLYRQPTAISQMPDTNPLAPAEIGSARMGYGMLIPQPLMADNLNCVPLEDEHRLLIGIMFPNAVERDHRFSLTADDYRLLRTWLCLLPRESGMHRYESASDFPDNYKKYLLYGDGTTPIDPALREFNVVGRAYGFMSDVAYFADFKAGVEFFLSAVIYVNEDGIVNDDVYEYNTIALPFFSALGASVYGYEKSRPRLHKPDLREFEPAIVKTSR